MRYQPRALASGCFFFASLTFTLGWIETLFFWKVHGVNVSKVVSWYPNTVYKILAPSVRCKDGRQLVEALEMLKGPKNVFHLLSFWGQKASPG